MSSFKLDLSTYKSSTLKNTVKIVNIVGLVLKYYVSHQLEKFRISILSSIAVTVLCGQNYDYRILSLYNGRIVF